MAPPGPSLIILGTRPLYRARNLKIYIWKEDNVFIESLFTLLPCRPLQLLSWFLCTLLLQVAAEDLEKEQNEFLVSYAGIKFDYHFSVLETGYKVFQKDHIFETICRAKIIYLKWNLCNLHSFSVMHSPQLGRHLFIHDLVANLNIKALELRLPSICTRQTA